MFHYYSCEKSNVLVISQQVDSASFSTAIDSDSSTYKIPHHYLPLGVDEGSLGFFRIGEMEEEFLQSQGEVLPKRPPDSIDICQHNPRAPICPTLVKGRFQLNNFPSKCQRLY